MYYAVASPIEPLDGSTKTCEATFSLTVLSESSMTPDSIAAASQIIDLTVTEPTTDPRIDAWLALHLADLSRSRLQKLITQGQVKLNDQL